MEGGYILSTLFSNRVRKPDQYAWIKRPPRVQIEPTPSNAMVQLFLPVSFLWVKRSWMSSSNVGRQSGLILSFLPCDITQQSSPGWTCNASALIIWWFWSLIFFLVCSYLTVFGLYYLETVPIVHPHRDQIRATIGPPIRLSAAYPQIWGRYNFTQVDSGYALLATTCLDKISWQWKTRR